MRVKVIITLLVIFALAAGVVFLNSQSEDPYKTVELIESRINGHGDLVDYSNEIGVQSKDDIGYRKRDGVLYLVYGKLEIKLEEAVLYEAEMQQKLRHIFITVHKNKETGEIYFKYKGEVVPEFVA